MTCKYDHAGQWGDALDAFERCTESNPDCVWAVMRIAELQRLLDDRNTPDLPAGTTAEMVEPPLDHVSYTIPERRSNRSIVLNPLEIVDNIDGLVVDQAGMYEEEEEASGEYYCEQTDVSGDSDEEEWSSDDEDVDADISQDSE